MERFKLERPYSDMRKTCQIFIRILKENGVYAKYVHNLYKGEPFTPFAATLRRNKIQCKDKYRCGRYAIALREILNDSFDWEMSNEGLDFWSLIYFDLRDVGENLDSIIENKKNINYRTFKKIKGCLRIH